MKNTFVNVSSVAATAIVCTLASVRAASAAVPHIALAAPADAPITEDVRAELGMRGCRVSMFAAPSSGCFGDDLKNMAQDADAAVCVDHEVHVFVRQGGALAHTDTVVTNGGAADSAEITAIRVAEIIRVRLEAPPGAAPTASVAPAAAPSSAASQVAAAGSDMGRSDGLAPKHAFHLGVAGGFLMDAGSGPYVSRIPTMPITTLSLSYALDSRFEMTARAALALGTSLSGSFTPGGYATLGPSVRLVDLDFLRVKLGGGVGGMYLNYDTSTSEIYPFMYADTSLDLPITKSLTVSAISSIGRLFDQVHVPVSSPLTGVLSASWLL